MGCLPNEVMYETVMNAIVLPVFFLSTALFPADGLSGGLKIAVNLNPFTHVINILRDLILQGNIVYRDVSFVVVLLIGMCGISFSWAFHKLRKKTALQKPFGLIVEDRKSEERECPLSITTVQDIKNLLSAIIDYAVMLAIIKYNPICAVKVT